MKSEYYFKGRENGGIVEITLPDGEYFRITFSDNENHIKVQTISGSMCIYPSVSNEVKIIANKNT